MNGDFVTLEVTLDAGVVFVSITNPPLNILDAALLQDLDRFAGRVRDEADLRVIVFQSGDAEFFIPRGEMRFVDNPQAFASLGVPPHHGWLRHLTSGKVPAGGDHDEPG